MARIKTSGTAGRITVVVSMRDSSVQSIASVNKMWPLLRSIATSIVKSWQEIVELKITLTIEEAKSEANRGNDWGNKISGIQAEINIAIDKLNGYIQEVEALGGYIEEFKRGIMNFPAPSSEIFHNIIAPRRIMLCIQPIIEDQVMYFHEIDEFFNDRLKITL